MNRKQLFVRMSLLATLVVAPAVAPSARAQTLTPVLGASTIVGTGSAGDTGDGGQAIHATIRGNYSIALDKTGDVYFTDGTDAVIRKMTPAGIVSTIAGIAGSAGYSGDGGLATSAKLNLTYGAIAFDQNGNLLICDSGNNVIRKIDQNGIITTIAGTGGTVGYAGDGGPAVSAQLHTPYGVVADRAGNIYIADTANYRIRKINTGGVISTFAGTGTKGDTGDGGPALSATINSAAALWIDLAGDLYIAEYGGDVIRMVDTSGNIHTVAGVAGATGTFGNGGPATSGDLYSPHTAMGDQLGNLFIDDEDDHAVRMVNAAGIISTLAGNGKGYAGDGAPASTAQFDYPYALILDAANNMYVADQDNYRIRLLSLNTGFAATAVGTTAAQNVFVQSTVAVTPSTAAITPTAPTEFTLGMLSGCSLGTLLAANTPCTVPVTFQPSAPGLQSARLTLTDTSGNVTAIGLSGVGVAPEVSFSLATIATVAGNGMAGSAGTSGPASSAGLSAPRGGVVDSAGNIYFADSGNNIVRRIDAVSGAISTVAGKGTAGYSGDGGAATSAQLNAPAKVVLDAAGDLYIADTGNSVIRYVSAATGLISTIAGNGTAGYTGDGGAATAAELNHPQGLAVDLGGHVYVADTGNNAVRYFGNGGMITTLTGTGTAGYAGDGGNAYGALLNAPQAVALGQNGTVYIADTGNDVVRMISATNQISTVAGMQGNAANTGDGGIATAAALSQPSDIALDAAGDLYIAAGGKVRAVNTAGVIETVAGTGAAGSYSGEGGAATSAVIPAPASNLMLDSAANLYLADTAGNRILKVAAATPMALNMGVQAAGTTGPATMFNVQNTGNSTLTLSGLSATTGFTLQTGGSSACSATTSLAPGQSCSIGIAFTPSSSANGAVSGMLTLTDNALNGTAVSQIFQLSGSTKIVYSTATSLSTSPASPVYGAAANIVATISNGSAPTGSVSFTVNGTSIGSAPVSNSQATIALPVQGTGTVSIGASYSGDANNNTSSATASITVKPAVLTVTATNATMAYGTSVPAFTYSVTGLVNGDTSSVVTGAPSETTTATSASPQGTYPITITQGTLAAANYTFTFVSGTLTVGPPPPPDFSLGITPATVTVPVGQLVTATLTLTPLYGYSGTVALSCSSPTVHVSCTFTGPLTGSGNSNPSYTQAKIAIGNDSASSRRPFHKQDRWLALGMPLCIVGIAAMAGRRRRWRAYLLPAALLAFLTVGMTSCSGNSTASATAGTYPITVTAADTTAKLSHTATIIVTTF